MQTDALRWWRRRFRLRIAIYLGLSGSVLRLVFRLTMSKVLLVEDNEMNRDMLSRRLIRQGYEVVVAVDGEQGVEAALRERPAIVLMDMSLPVLDGWEAPRRLKADEA